MFDALNVSGSGMELHKTWMDAISDNVANVNTVRRTDQQAFQSLHIDGDIRQLGHRVVRSHSEAMTTLTEAFYHPGD